VNGLGWVSPHSNLKLLIDIGIISLVQKKQEKQEKKKKKKKKKDRHFP
jgi:hypothetical protein